MVAEIANVLRERRLSAGVSMNALAAASYLDRAALHRAEAGERIPTLAFWIDWSDTLGTSLEKVMAEAMKRTGKKSGEPPARKPLPAPPAGRARVPRDSGRTIAKKGQCAIAPRPQPALMKRQTTGGFGVA